MTLALFKSFKNFLWLQVLHPAENIFAYGMRMPNGEVKNFMMCLQAFFLKNLLFGKKMRASVKLVRIFAA